IMESVHVGEHGVEIFLGVVAVDRGLSLLSLEALGRWFGSLVGETIWMRFGFGFAMNKPAL
ncbi:hypothetical protein Droror1_Dr00017969, partial [Drosera rotundifolia]